MVRLELNFVTSDFGLQVKRPEVAASDQCAGKSNSHRGDRVNVYRLGLRGRRVSAGEHSGRDGRCGKEHAMWACCSYQDVRYMGQRNTAQWDRHNDSECGIEGWFFRSPF